MGPGREYDQDPEWMRELTPPQRAFFRILTDQRVANMVAAGDLVGDMDADGVQLIRALGTDEYRALRQFMWRCKPEVLEFLYEMRKQEIEELEAAIETYLAFKRTGRVMKWGAITLFGAFIGMLAIWDKITTIFRIQK